MCLCYSYSKRTVEKAVEANKRRLTTQVGSTKDLWLIGCCDHTDSDVSIYRCDDYMGQVRMKLTHRPIKHRDGKNQTIRSTLHESSRPPCFPLLCYSVLISSFPHFILICFPHNSHFLYHSPNGHSFDSLSKRCFIHLITDRPHSYLLFLLLLFPSGFRFHQNDRHK